MTFLGTASHTVQDEMCPEHYGENGPKTWYAEWWNYGANIQHLPEIFRTPSTSDMNKFNAWIRERMQEIVGTNKNIIRELFE